MPQVHASAIVDPRVQLAHDVQVGPWCVVQGEVRVGPGTRLHERVTLRGPLILGVRNVLYPNVCVGLEPQHRRYQDPAWAGAGVNIGDDNLVREGVTIHRATGEAPTRVGSRNMLMVNAHLGHDAAIGDDCTLANGALLGGHVQLHDRVIVGGNAGLQQFVRVGRLAMISGGTGLTQDVPPFCTAYATGSVGSLNLIGLRRAGLRDHIDPLREAFDLFYRRGHTAPNALRLIEQQPCGRDPLVAEMVAFIRAAKRGITGYTRRGRAASGGEG